MKKLSIVIPMYYEEEVAEECYNRMTKVCNSIQNYEYEIIFGNDYVYSDTDSVKILNYKNHLKYFEKYNENILKKLKYMCNVYEIDISLLSPKNMKGEVKPLGVWDFEHIYDKFKTLGAKRYIVEYELY